jgi:uncharacterized membrane protein
VAERFKVYFLRGLAVLVPTVLTIAIFVAGYRFIHDYISSYLAAGLRHVLNEIASEDWVANNLDQRWMTLVLSVAGFLVALFGVLVVGAFLASVVGRTLWRLVENFIMNTPVLRQVYPYVKQVTDFFLTREQQKQLFSKVVAVEYPRKGIWSLGFVTGAGVQKVVSSVKKEFLTVLIPTSPTPFTGFVIMVPKKNAIELDMSIEEALRFTVSGGVITPTGQQALALGGPDADKQL